jgi:hypothetical protein
MTNGATRRQQRGTGESDAAPGASDDRNTAI